MIHSLLQMNVLEVAEASNAEIVVLEGDTRGLVYLRCGDAVRFVVSYGDGMVPDAAYKRTLAFIHGGTPDVVDNFFRRRSQKKAIC